MQHNSDPMSVYKADWPEAKQRLRDWWAGKATDRVAASVTAPRKGATRRPVRGTMLERWTDPDTIFHNLDAQLESTFFGGEAFPNHWAYIGPVIMGGFLGAELEFHENTVWQKPLFSSWDDADRLAFDPANRWWRFVCGLTRASVARARGRYLVTGCNADGLFDVIANLWGSEPTLMAMLDRPQVIRQVRDRLLAWFHEMNDVTFRIVEPYQEGHSDWLRLWAPGRMVTLQSDISCMVSPRLFNDLILEEIRQEAEGLDYSIYHLDGPGAIMHLEALLSIEALDGIQWVPGAGASPDPMDWLDLFRRVQAAGKRIVIYCPPDRVQPLLNAISRRGVFLFVGCADEDAAQRVLADLDRIGG